MTSQHGTHNDLHSEQGALPGEHPGRAKNPVIKVLDLAWLEFVKPDLAASERFAHAFGFTTVSRTADELQLRGTDAGAPCVIVRRGPRSRYLGAAFRAADSTDVLRLADATGAKVEKLPESIGGLTVDLTDPSGVLVRVVADTHELAALPAQPTQVFNFGHEVRRANATQRPPREPAKIQRLGHVVLQTTRYIETLNWYLEHLGLIVSDFKYYEGQRERGPTMSFIRCDRGTTPTDHHTLAMMLGPATGTCTRRTRWQTSTRWPRAGSTSASRASTAPGGSAGTSRAARSSTTGATRTGSWSSTSPTVTCSTAPWSPAGRR